MQVFIALVVLALTLIYGWLQYRRGYWQRRGIPHNRPALLTGNCSEWRRTKHISEIFRETYDQFKGTGPFAGFHFLMMKNPLILDLELVRNILIRDFNKFVDRGLFHNERDDPLTGNLFFLDGEKWRKLRQKMTPTFTSGKMRNMFPTVLQVGKELAAVFAEKVAEKAAASEQVLEITDLVGRYTADVIGTCAFGLDCNSLRNPNAEFVVMGKSFFTKPRHNLLVDGFIHSFPKQARNLRLRVINQEVHEFYMRVVKETIAQREKNNIHRNDFMDILIQLKNEKSIKNEFGEEIGGLSVEEVAAQAFVFFLAGFETSSTTMGFALYELAQNEEVQNKLRQEINEVLTRHSGEFNYECMKEMRYLDQVIDETLRKHPIVPDLIRVPRERYETSDPKYYIEKDSVVIIPVIGIHYDENIYPEPNKFMPERFTPEEIQKRPACSWLPFGEGPRNCIGMRFGKIQTSIGLAYLIQNFKFSVAPQTEIPYKLVKHNFLINAENGIHLKVEKV